MKLKNNKMCHSKSNILDRIEDARRQQVVMSTLSRDKLESTLRKRFFYTPSFEIYSGVSGLFDLGPPGLSAAE